MAELLAGFVCPHAPPMFMAPQAMPPEVWPRVEAAFEAIRSRIAELDVDTVIIVSADHYGLFGPGCLPAALIGIGDVDTSSERLPGLADGPVENNTALAAHILETTRDLGFDLAVAKSIRVDHGIIVPARMCVPEGVRIVPIYVAAGVGPVIRTQRCFDLGRAVGAAVKSFPAASRVAIIGSGGISHRVGMPGMGEVTPEFDTWVLDCIARADAAAIIALKDEDVILRAGNGALEIRQFLVAMGAVEAARSRVIAYEPAPGWFTGLGFAEQLSAAAVARLAA